MPLKLVNLGDVEPEKVRFLWYPYVPIRKMTLISGDPGAGKSWLTLALASAVSRGRPIMGNAVHQGRVLLLSLEDGLADTIRPRLDILEADPKNIVAVDQALTFNKAGVALLQTAFEEVRPSLVIIDPIQSYFGAGTSMNLANEVRPVLDRIKCLTEVYDTSTLLVRHLRKARGGAAMYQGMGSIDFTAAVRSEVLVGVQDGARVMAHVKSSTAPLGPSHAYTIEDGRFEWLGIVNVSAEDLAAEPPDNEERKAMEEALDFLRSTLAGKDFFPSKGLDELAKEAGIAIRTLKRARKRLGVLTKQRDGQWWVRLPDQNAIR